MGVFLGRHRSAFHRAAFVATVICGFVTHGAWGSESIPVTPWFTGILQDSVSIVSSSGGAVDALNAGASGIGMARLADHGPLLAANAPTSREQLFDVVRPERKEPSGITGFYGIGVAYTYADPAHWSRAVNRLQLAAEGSLSDRVKYKLGARIDADPVYFGSDFYLPAVKRDQRADLIWRENYIDVSAGDWDFRLGAQHIVWGEVVGLFVADVVSARDQREFLLPSFDIIRIPQWAVRAEYYLGESHLELVWIPIPTFDRIGKPGSDFYPVRLPSRTPAEVASQIDAIDKPASGLDNSSYGVRVNTLIDGWDIAGFFYRGFSTEPTFYSAGRDGGPSATLQPQYDRIEHVGTTLSKDLNAFVLRAEAVYTRGKNFSSTDPMAVRGAVPRSTLDYILSMDMPVATDGRLNLQAFQRVYFGGDDQLALTPGTFGASAFFSIKMTNSIEPQLLWLQTFGGGGGLIRPKINWNAGKNISFAIGADVFTGPSNGFFGRYNNRDRLYTELRYDF